MASGTSFHLIEKLNEENYESWKLQMKSFLVCNELWGYVIVSTIVKTEENAAAWTTKDDKALALIVLNVSRGQLNLVKKAKTSKEAWNELKRVFESKEPVRKATLYKQLYRMKKDSSVTMNQYISEYMDKAE